MYVSGTVRYSADLIGLLLPETSFPAAPPVTDVRVKCDGTRAEITVALGRFATEADGSAAAEAAMRRVWGALLVGVPHAFVSVKRPGRAVIAFEPEPKPGVAHATAAVAMGLAADAFVTITPGLQQIERVRSIAASASWNPGASIVFERYVRALGETDQVAQFLALYEVATLAVEVHRGEDEELPQETFDAELRTLDPRIPMLQPEGRAKKNETPFTRARNRLVHPRGRGVTWEDARSYAAGQLQPFRELVAKLVARSEGVQL